VIWSVADLRDLDALVVAPLEVVYACVSIGGEPSGDDEAVLDGEESERSRRFVHPSDRNRFILSHTALRVVLGRALGIPPADVAYEAGRNGKPRLAGSPTPLQFNLSHSHELGLLAVGRELPLGIDIEHVRDLPDLIEIADQHFSPEELLELKSLPEADQQGAFFRCWTRKEAVIKVHGDGLEHPLDSFEVDLEPGSASALRRYGGLPADEVELSLRDLPAPAGYVAAGAVADAAGTRITWRELSTTA
jgi:4'-phosphopantetheinyl transferase